MAQEFHFQHHLLEAKRNRFRFVAALFSIFVATTGIAVQYYAGTAENIIKINDSAKGTGLNQFEYSGLWETANPAAAFNGDNSFSKTVGGYFQVRFSGTQVRLYGEKGPTLSKIAISVDGGPETVVDPYVGTRVEQQLLYTSPVLPNANHIIKVRNTGTKNAQAIAMYMSADRLDISVAATPTATPVPTPIRTATPTPVVTPKSTPLPTAVPAQTSQPSQSNVKPAGTPVPPGRTPAPISQPAANKPAGAAPAGAPAQDTVPTAPQNLSAMVTGDNAIITLIWGASTSGTGISGYRVERMPDGGSWSVLADKTPALTFLDSSAAFAVHYKYRVSAISGTGKVSDYASVDATTGNFIATSVNTAASNFQSDDKLATAEVPAGTLATNANCSIITMPMKIATAKMKLVAGSYSLVCKDSSGKVLRDFGRAVKWSVNLKGKLKGAANPDAAVVDSVSGASASIPGATYDAKAEVMHFNQTSANTVAVLAEAKRGVPVLWIILMGMMLIGWGVFIYLLRHHQIEKYHDYIMSKYYNL